jgi:uncharacterized protein YdhG (YjbR/CyaY superfamily)
VDDYIESFPANVQAVLRELRTVMRQAEPRAGEKIAYQMPTLTLDGKNLVHFAAWTRHVSVYPAPAGDTAFEEAIAPYRTAKGTLTFPLTEPIPYPLVGQVVELLAARSRHTAS